MSINIATLGMFQSCCGRLAGGGGGAVPTYRDEKLPTISVLVRKVEIETLGEQSLSNSIKIKHVDFN